ncbi:hypothetical protein IT072_13865 [Leifsonia sp. ZF2019]|uniref:hypothetical protein n=1 Tax=Leifsonia sp. ZF2019 TaxID=2781978 RepID=UPI001CC137A8|nr:hypothetical protein [Leifsonia sp. ZF2019]UAJ78344.1 hypothetical protein IT072_13865 [Leifsonia sp. ZF2019]
MNLTESIAPRSDQLNADDLIAGPVTVTVTEVRQGNAEQPVHVVTEEFGNGRPYKPSKSMRRVLVAAWGTDSDTYAGRQLTLFRNPTIRFGKEEVGGIQISHLSHIDGPLKIALTVTRGKRAPFVVQPIGPGRDWITELEQVEGNPEAIAALGVAAKNAGADAETLDVIRGAFMDAKGATS